MLEEITQQLSQASNSKKACRIKMKGEPFTRTVNPYGICTTLANHIVLVCWQTLGFTKAGGKEGYRNLLLSEIEEVEMLNIGFHVPEDFNPSDGQYKEWLYHV